MKKNEKLGREVGPQVNDNRISQPAILDPRILRIAGAIGRQLAREHAKGPQRPNDNALSRDDEPEGAH